MGKTVVSCSLQQCEMKSSKIFEAKVSDISFCDKTSCMLSQSPGLLQVSRPHTSEM